MKINRVLMLPRVLFSASKRSFGLSKSCSKLTRSNRIIAGLFKPPFYGRLKGLQTGSMKPECSLEDLRFVSAQLLFSKIIEKRHEVSAETREACSKGIRFERLTAGSLCMTNATGSSDKEGLRHAVSAVYVMY